MKRFLYRTGLFFLLVLSLSVIVVSSYNLYSMNQAEKELYQLKLKNKATESPSDQAVEAKKITAEELAGEESFFIPVPETFQNPDLPQGCEITALTAVLNYYGYEADPLVMANKYLPKEGFFKEHGINYGPDPNVAYAGDPTKESGWFCYAKPIVSAANLFFEEEQIFDQAEDFSGKRRDRIIDEVNKGNPVILWVTLNLEPPRFIPGWVNVATGKQVRIPLNSHCVVLNGFYGKDLLVMDPLQGEIKVDSDQFFESYYDLGAYGVKLDRN